MLGSQGATPDARSRILQGLITGIGFIGGGAIFRDHNTATGFATAASIWSIGITGAAVGFGYYHIAIALVAFDLLTFTFLTPIKRRLDAPLDAPPRSDERR